MMIYARYSSSIGDAILSITLITAHDASAAVVAVAGNDNGVTQ